MAANQADIQNQLGQLKKVTKETVGELLSRIESTYTDNITPLSTEEELIRLFASIVTEFPPITLQRYKAIKQWIETKSGKALPEFEDCIGADNRTNMELIKKVIKEDKFSDYVTFLTFNRNILKEDNINKTIPNPPNDPSFKPRGTGKVVKVVTSAEKRQEEKEKEERLEMWAKKARLDAEQDATNKSKVTSFVRLIKKYNDEFSDIIGSSIVKQFVMPGITYSQIKVAIASISDNGKKDGMLSLLENSNPEKKPFDFLEREPAAFSENGCKLLNVDAGGNNFVAFGKLNKTEDGKFNAKMNGIVLTKDIKIAKPSTSTAAYFKVDETNMVENKNVFDSTFDDMNAKRPGFNPFANAPHLQGGPVAKPLNPFLAGIQALRKPSPSAVNPFLAGIQALRKPSPNPQHGGGKCKAKKTKRRKCKTIKRKCKSVKRKRV